MYISMSLWFIKKKKKKSLISITANLLLSNVKDNKLKKVFDKCKAIHAVKEDLIVFVNQKFKIVFLKIMVCIVMNVKIPSVIYAHLIYKNIQLS